MLGYQAREPGVLGLQQLKPLELREVPPLGSPAPVGESLLRDAVLAAESEVVAVSGCFAQDLDDLLLAEPFLQAPLLLLGGILDENFPWSNFWGAGHPSLYH